MRYVNVLVQPIGEKQVLRGKSYDAEREVRKRWKKNLFTMCRNFPNSGTQYYWN